MIDGMLPRCLSTVVATALLLTACGGDDPVRIDVLLVTDYEAGSDFSRIRSELALAGDVAPEFIREQVLEAGAFSPIDPVASFELEEGRYIVRVSLLDRAGVEVIAESVIVEANGDVRATVLISREGDAGIDGGRDGGMDGSAPDADSAVDATADAADGSIRGFCGAEDVVGCWTFESNADDGSGNGHDLTTSAIAYPMTNWGRGLGVGPGADARIDAISSLLILSTVSFEGFVNFDALPSGSRMSMLERSNEYAIHFQTGGNIRCTVVTTSGAASAEATDRAPAVGEWHHYACVYDGSEIILYVDGTVAGREPQTGLLNQDGGPLVIGSDAPSGNADIDGALDEIRIFRDARTATEIAIAAER